MIYSNRMKNRPGFGYIVPFQKIINTVEELIQESIALSVAEGMKGNFVRPWGVLTYLFNDNKIDSNMKKEIIKFFRKRKNMEFNIDDYKVAKEKSCITKSLKLNINWPQSIITNDNEKLNQFDFLMATATKPEPNNRLLTFEDIAQGVKADNERKYFINNLGNGIISHEDFEISKRL